MTAAAVVLRSTADAADLVGMGLRDSKRLDRPARRRLHDEIVARAAAWAVVHVGADEIDRLGIAPATARAFAGALGALRPAAAFALVDGLRFDGLPLPAAFVVRGEEASASIAAASVLAKETRDRVMEALDAEHPGWGFAEHKGYGTRAHVEAIERLGPSPVHRRSFRTPAP